MAIVSKEEFYAAVGNSTCQTFVHPWSTGCVKAALELLVFSAIGCSKFSGTLCLVSI